MVDSTGALEVGEVPFLANPDASHVISGGTGALQQRFHDASRQQQIQCLLCGAVVALSTMAVASQGQPSSDGSRGEVARRACSMQEL